MLYTVSKAVGDFFTPHSFSEAKPVEGAKVDPYAQYKERAKTVAKVAAIGLGIAALGYSAYIFGMQRTYEAAYQAGRQDANQSTASMSFQHFFSKGLVKQGKSYAPPTNHLFAGSIGQLADQIGSATSTLGQKALNLGSDVTASALGATASSAKSVAWKLFGSLPTEGKAIVGFAGIGLAKLPIEGIKYTTQAVIFVCKMFIPGAKRPWA